jgi:hypothetical protein
MAASPADDAVIREFAQNGNAGAHEFAFMLRPRLKRHAG